VSAACARVALTCALLPLVVGCGDGDDPGPWVASMTLPALPFWHNDVATIDAFHLQAEADAACAAGEGSTSAAAFFLGELPLLALDALCDPADAAGSRAWLGDLYLSGYFGGLWLADVMGSMGGPGGGDDGKDPEVSFQNLMDEMAVRLGVAAAGSDAEVLDYVRSELYFFLLLYGYNKGYLEVALEQPPPGLTAPPDFLACPTFLDCQGPGIDLAVTDRFRPALAKLADPPDQRWKEMAREADSWEDASVQQGRGVWEGILEEKTIAADRYEMLLDLSLGYLLAAEAAVLGKMTAYADQRADDGRCAIRVGGGLYLWSNAYFGGLFDSGEATAEDFPTLQCVRD